MVSVGVIPNNALRVFLIHNYLYFGFDSSEWLAFSLLDWNSVAVENLSNGDKVLVGWFQSVSTRTAGFNAIDISQVRIVSEYLFRSVNEPT